MHRAKLNDESAATQQQLITYAIVGLVSFSLLSTATWFAFNYSGNDDIIDFSSEVKNFIKKGSEFIRESVYQF